MDFLNDLALGFDAALTGRNLLVLAAGTLLGAWAGGRPGFGPLAAIALLLPAVRTFEAAPALILLVGVCGGAGYGASVRGVLSDPAAALRPGASAVDGYQMACQGRAGAALATAGFGAFFAGCIGATVVAVVARPLTRLASGFGPADAFSLTVLGLVGAVVLTSGSLLKAIAMAIVGLLLAQRHLDMVAIGAHVGIDLPALDPGNAFAAIAIGVFGFGAIVAHPDRSSAAPPPTPATASGSARRTRAGPSRDELARSWPAIARGTAIGAVLGVLPGSAARLASAVSYAVERKAAGAAGRFGRGDIRGVTGPAAASHAGVQTAFVPTLALGVPPNAAMALIVGAMTIKGIPPGPQLLTREPQLFWALIASLWIGGVLVLVMSLAAIGSGSRVPSRPQRWLAPTISLFGCLGLYTLAHRPFELGLAALFALIGQGLRKLSCDPAPLLLGFVLEPTLEDHLRRALRLSLGDWSAFVTQPLSAALLACAAVLIVAVLLPSIAQQRRAVLPGL